MKRELIKQFISKLHIPHIVAGSYVRGKEECKDIDLIVSEDYKDFWKKMNVKNIVMNGERHDVVELNFKDDVVRLDVFYYKDSKEIPFLVNYFTGSKFFNIAIRSIAKKKGYRLNQFSLKNLKTNKEIYVNNERELFEILGLRFIPSKERNCENIKEAFKIIRKYKKNK